MSTPLQNKLFDLEVTPPPEAWNNIRQELVDRDASSGLSKKMEDFELAPPSSALENIRSAISSSANEEVHLIPFRRKWFRLVAAAIILLIVTAASYFLFFDLPENSQKSGNGKEVVLKPHKKIPLPVPDGHVVIETQKISDIPNTSIGADISSVYTTITKTPGTENTKELLPPRVVNNLPSANHEEAVALAAKPIRNEHGRIIEDKPLVRGGNAEYISITSPNGEQTKISSKFMNALVYINEDAGIEGSFPDDAFVQSVFWKSLFKEWRDKMLSSDFIPASGNGFDILELKDLLLKDDKPR